VDELFEKLGETILSTSGTVREIIAKKKEAPFGGRLFCISFSF